MSQRGDRGGGGSKPHLWAIEMAGTTCHHVPDIAQHSLVQAPLEEGTKAVSALQWLKGGGGGVNAGGR